MKTRRRYVNVHSMRLESISSVIISTSFQPVEDYDQALTYLQRSVDLREKHIVSFHDRRTWITTLSLMIEIYDKQNDDINKNIWTAYQRKSYSNSS